MNLEYGPLVTDELVEFSQQPPQVSRRHSNCPTFHKNLDNIITQIIQGRSHTPHLKMLHNDACPKKCDPKTWSSTHPQNRQTWSSIDLQHPQICKTPRSSTSYLHTSAKSPSVTFHISATSRICKIPKSSTSRKCKQYSSKQSKKIKRFQLVSDCTWNITWISTNYVQRSMTKLIPCAKKYLRECNHSYHCLFLSLCQRFS